MSIPTRGFISLSLCCLRLLFNLERLWALLNHRVCHLISPMSPTVMHDNQWWLLDILFIFMLLMHMHDGMQQTIIVELVCSVLLFTFEGGFVAFWCGAERVVIVVHARSTSHFHELMISLATHRIIPAPSVSPQTSLPPTSLDPMVILLPQEPPERPVNPVPQESPERSNSLLPWPDWETNPFWGQLSHQVFHYKYLVHSA